jgi:hypothetical protein
MGERTLTAVCSVIALLVVLAMGFFRVKTPHNIPFILIYVVLMALLLLVLKPLNRGLLGRRKARGREIQDEESCEVEETDAISLRPMPDEPVQNRSR